MAEYTEELAFGFVGLGAMGFPMAANLSAATKKPTRVWNRTRAIAVRHAQAHGTCAVVNTAELHDCALVALCLPTSAVSKYILERLVPAMTLPNAVILDHSSGNPLETKALAERVRELSGGRVTYVDAPVSGGPAGATAGTLTTMVGCTAAFAESSAALTLALRAVAKKVVFLDVVGAGNAVKCVNNFMNVSHLALASECFYGLGLAGVNVGAALEAINGSSGRSLQTEVRLPTQVLNSKYKYGFDLALMLKDVRQAKAFLRDTFSKKNTRIAEEDMLLSRWGNGLESLLVDALERDTALEGVEAPDYTRSVARYFDGANLPGMPAADSAKDKAAAQGSDPAEAKV